MRRLPLTVWLSLLSVGLVALVVLGLTLAGLALFRNLASEHARARVQLAAATAYEALTEEAEATETAARLLRERPTLLRLVRQGSKGELTEFLERFRESGELDGCAVLVDVELFAATPADAPWHELLDDEPAGLRFQRLPDEAGTPIVLASATLAGDLPGKVFTLRRIDHGLPQLASHVGMPLEIVDVPPDRPATTLSSEGWLGLRAFPSAAGAEVLAISASIPRAEVERSVSAMQRAFAVWTALAFAVAVLLGAVAARAIARPFAILGEAAERIGAGDLVTPVPRLRGAEASALSRTMEAMRSGLRSTTAELRRREAEAKAILGGIVEGIFAVDLERKVQYLNPQAAELFAVPVEAAVGRFCGDLLYPGTPEDERPCSRACPILDARSRGNSSALERARLPGGARSLVLTSAPPEGGRQVQIMRDETEVEAARRSRDAVLANVSHELKTPLSAQLASIELLVDALGAGAPRPARELIASLERSTLRLTHLIDNLLESVRIETKRGGGRRVRVEVEDWVEEATAAVMPLLLQRGQRLEVQIAEPVPAVSGVPVQLTQVLVNLLANANKYAPAGSQIRVGAGARAETVELWVEDDGPGLRAVGKVDVFERFQRLDETAEGMGLGLWIVKSLVVQHGGQVRASSSPSGGARFIVQLPVWEDE